MFRCTRYNKQQAGAEIIFPRKTFKKDLKMINQRAALVFLFYGFIMLGSVESFQTSRLSLTTRTTTISLEALTDETDSVEKTTEKYGLEIGLAQAAKEGDGESAKSLLKKYGVAYLATSIPLAILSFSLCYVLVDNGVDVGALLEKIGIENSGTTDTAGTVALAYAAHKAASPIRFPPTVLLTPVVAKMIGREPEAAE